MRGFDYQPPAPLNGLCAIGDSNTHMGYMGLPEQCRLCNGLADNYSSRYTQLLATSSGWRILNYGQNGRMTRDYLGTGIGVFDWPNGEIPAAWLAARAKYYLCCFGLNDAAGGGVSEAVFKQNTRDLISVIEDAGSIPLLMTNVSVYYTANLGVSWYSFDRNPTIDSYDDQYRNLNAEIGVRLIDVNAAFKADIALGNYDHRIRSDGVTFTAVNDSSHTGDPEWANWHTNIHYNQLGAAIVANTIQTYITANGLTPT